MFQPADGVSNVLQAGYKLFEKVLVVLCDLDTYEELAITDKKGIHRRRACNRPNRFITAKKGSKRRR